MFYVCTDRVGKSCCTHSRVFRQSGSSVRYIKFVKILIDAKCLVSIKCVSFTKRLPSAKV